MKAEVNNNNVDWIPGVGDVPERLTLNDLDFSYLRTEQAHESASPKQTAPEELMPWQQCYQII